MSFESFISKSLFLSVLLSLLLQSPTSVLAEISINGPEATADSLHEALTQGDEFTVRKLLHSQVLIFESGGQESSLEEYASHHMTADMKFTAAMEREVLFRDISESGDQAVVLTRSRLFGTYNDKDIDIKSTETLIMAKSSDMWRITHIHWSSR